MSDMSAQLCNLETGEVRPISNEIMVRCWGNDLSEIGIINKINENQEGFFDFSKNIVDVGAYIGVYTFLTNFCGGYMFEGNMGMLSYMYANKLLFNKWGVFIYHALLSDVEECIEYDGYNCKPGDSPEFNTETSIAFTTTKMDTYPLDNIGLIKVDVEGMEERVLRGGVGTIIRNNYPPILFECWNVGYYGMTQEKHDRLFNFLKDLGYDIIEGWGDFQTHLAINSKFYLR